MSTKKRHRLLRRFIQVPSSLRQGERIGVNGEKKGESEIHREEDDRNDSAFSGTNELYCIQAWNKLRSSLTVNELNSIFLWCVFVLCSPCYCIYVSHSADRYLLSV